MQIEKKKLSELTPAPYNPRKISKKELERLKRSLEEFGYVEPVIWNKATGYVVGGHQRLKALKELGVEEVDCVVVDLSEDKEKALNIALNKISGGWDSDKLYEILDELDNNKFDITFTGFEMADLDDYRFDSDIDTGYFGEAREKTYDIYRLNEYDETRAVGLYQLPTLQACLYVPDDLLTFNDIRNYKGSKKGLGVHFFIDDYKFESIWTNPFKYIERLRTFACVLTPDFSTYSDMPFAMQIWNLYRSRMIGQILQDAGLNVIPTIRTFGNEPIDWCFEGIEQGGTIAFSTIGAEKEGKEFQELCQHEITQAIEIIKPSCIINYGTGNIKYDYQNVPVKNISSGAYWKRREF